MLPRPLTLKHRKRSLPECCMIDIVASMTSFLSLIFDKILRYPSILFQKYPHSAFKGRTGPIGTLYGGSSVCFESYFMNNPSVPSKYIYAILKTV
ncbi:DEKNAAE104552 [Brettanomyces naardenensis]|uniref:DEKNAAE104552 n=1 Tax=Brettanomyces naardenensis TaxID=13370 RepID=A0A448YR80_BRENA|nr:DEKNAAE104552 [Brettanomyces naardenensis]